MEALYNLSNTEQDLSKMVLPYYRHFLNLVLNQATISQTGPDYTSDPKTQKVWNFGGTKSGWEQMVIKSQQMDI